MTAAVSSRPSWIQSGRIPSLDGLRALAVSLVLVAHVHQTHSFPSVPFFERVGHCGAAGVDLFFVLSGFLITLLLCREQERTGGVSLRAFYLRRLLRIVPAYVAYLGVVAAFQFAGAADISSRDWLAAGSYTMNFRHRPAWEVGHIWSLSIEEHFYLLWPPLFALLPRRKAIWLLAALLAVEPLLRVAILILAPQHSAMTDLWTFTRLDAIAAGCLLALLAQRNAGWLDRMGRFWPLALLVLIAALACALLSGKFAVVLAPSLVAGSLAVLIWASVQRAPRWLDHPVLAAVGVGSYSLYLWQQLFLDPHREAWWTTFPQNLVLAVACAVASYWLTEKPFLRLKDRLGAKRSQVIVTVCADPVPVVVNFSTPPASAVALPAVAPDSV